ncbi:MAG: hypothetical protein ACTSW2_01190, partial [Alphaproteobacteria bacterium]
NFHGYPFSVDFWPSTIVASWFQPVAATVWAWGGRQTALDCSQAEPVKQLLTNLASLISQDG